MVELRGVSKSYGSTVALHPTDLAFEKGKTTALIGPSGCGKSTLLRLILGLVTPSSGQVIFDNEVVQESNLISVRRRTGYVIQEGGLFPHLTALQNLTLVALDNTGRKATKTIKSRVESRTGQPDAKPTLKELSEEGKAAFADLYEDIDKLAKIARIPRELLSRYPAELSGGQRQRVSLMRAMILRPQVLLLDEPLASLDPMVRAALQTDLKAIFDALGKTVVFVTHDMAEAAYLANTIVLLRDGKIVQKGTLEDFQQRPAEPFVTEFLNAQRSLVAL